MASAGVTSDVPSDVTAEDKKVNVDEIVHSNKTANQIGEMADAQGSTAVIAALIFGFAVSFLGDAIDDGSWTFSIFSFFLMGTVGLSCWGLIVCVVWYGAARMINGWGVVEKFTYFETRTNLSRTAANAAVYASLTTFMIALLLNCFLINSGKTQYVTACVNGIFIIVAMQQAFFVANTYYRCYGLSITNEMNVKKKIDS
eukprot:64185_1